jgi:hypothetical protein
MVVVEPPREQKALSTKDFGIVALERAKLAKGRLKVVAIGVGTAVWALTPMLPITHDKLKFCDVR